MAPDIVPDLLDRIMSEFSTRVNNSKVIKEISGLIDAGTADYKTATRYATEIGRILSGVLKENITASTMPDGHMYYNIANRIMQSTLSRDHAMVADTTAHIQAILNNNAKIGIKPIKPPVNQSRIKGFVERLSNEPVVDDVAWILDEPIVNYSQSVVNEVMEANADFHMEAGMEPTIERTIVSDTCDWCKNLAGTYKYADVKRTGHPVFQRHLNCDCDVVYNPGDGKRINVHTKEIAGSEADRIGQERIRARRIREAELAAERRKAARLKKLRN